MDNSHKDDLCSCFESERWASAPVSILTFRRSGLYEDHWPLSIDSSIHSVPSINHRAFNIVSMTAQPATEIANGGKPAQTPFEMISQGPCLPSIPRHPTFASERQWRLEKMALAFRVFPRKGYADGLAGHISVRDPEYPHTFWTASILPHQLFPSAYADSHCPSRIRSRNTLRYSRRVI